MIFVPLRDLTRDQAAANIEEVISEDRLIQDHFTDKDSHGRRLACLLSAIHPEVYSPKDCPAHIMPRWMAEVIPSLFDSLPPDDVYSFSRRFAKGLRTLDPSQKSLYLKPIISILESLYDAKSFTSVTDTGDFSEAEDLYRKSLKFVRDEVWSDGERVQHVVKLRSAMRKYREGKNSFSFRFCKAMFQIFRDSGHDLTRILRDAGRVYHYTSTPLGRDRSAMYVAAFNVMLVEMGV